MFAFRVDNGERVWQAAPPGCGGKPACSPAQSSAVTGIPGAVFSGSIDDAARLVEAQASQLTELQSENKRQADSLAKYRAADLHAAATPNADGVRVVVERLAAGVDSIRALALAYSSLPRAVFIAASSAPPSVLLATSADSGVDAGKTLRPLLEHAGGRGGGSPRLAQGSVPSTDAVEQVVADLRSSPSRAG